MSYNTKNYGEHGGEKWVVGGEIEIKGKLNIAEGAEVEGVVTADVVNNLTTTTTGSALDAAQGKVLKGLIDAVDGVGDDNVGDGLAFADGVISVATGAGLEIDEDDAVSVVIGDSLELDDDGALQVKPAANIPDSEEATSPTTAEFNALLAALKAAGLMAADED